MITAEIVADSISPAGHRLTTLKLVYPKFIHGEFMTHRVFSRNASSSRAIPVARLLAEVRDSALRARPVSFPLEQRGMQGGDELDDDRRAMAIGAWGQAALSAADHAEGLVRLGVHKSIVNRILEPFSHIRVVVSATEWANFDGLRLHKDAQPEMRTLAEAIYAARKASEPKTLSPGEWHLPFVDDEDWHQYPQDFVHGGDGYSYDEALGNLIKVSVARCARVSYETFENPGRRSHHSDDFRLYDKLVGAQPMHASPAEHQATPDPVIINGLPSYREDLWGNFVGWRQHRKMLPGEAVAPLPEAYR